MPFTKLLPTSIDLAQNFTFTGTVAGAGENNTPAFYVGKTSNQTVSDNTKTKVTWNEAYDTDSAFASDKFTVPSGKAGKYNFYIHVTLSTTGSFGVRNPRVLKQLCKDEIVASQFKKKLNNGECRLLGLGEKRKRKKTDPIRAKQTSLEDYL